MNSSIYDYKHYRDYLRKVLPISGPARGGRAKLAEALGCRNGFISLVLGEGAHFSLEHAVKASRFLQHDSDEQDYFLLMVHRDRAGCKELENYYQNKMNAIHERRKEIRERIRPTSALSERAQMLYYSSWYYTAIHMCLRVPELQTRQAISDYLGVSQSVVADILNFMVEQGVATENKGRFSSLPTRMHLPYGSPILAKHHSNWRIKAIQSLDTESRNDLHYSLVMSLSQEAAVQIRSHLLGLIQTIEPILKTAKDEAVYALNLDLFSVAHIGRQS